MSGWGAAALYVAGMVAVGWLWLRCISGRRGALTVVQAAAAAFPVGAFALAYTWFLMMLIGIPLSRISIMGGALGHAVTAIAVAGIVKARFGRGPDAGRRWSPGEVLIAGLIVVWVGWQCRDLVVTPYGGDGLGFWRPKGVTIAGDGTVVSPFFRNPATLHTNRDYPVFLPVLQAGLIVWAAGPPPAAERIVFPAFLVSLFLLAWVGLRATLDRRRALLLLIVLAMVTQGKLLSGYATAPLAAFLLGALVFMLDYLDGDGRRGGALAVSIVLGAALVFTKTEGLLYLLLMLLSWPVGAWSRSRGERVRGALVVAAAVGALCLPWFWFRSTVADTFVHHFFHYLAPAHLEARISTTPYVSLLVLVELVSFPRWGPLWLLAAAAYWRGRTPALLIGFPAVAAVVWCVAVVATPPGLSWGLYTLDRFLFHMAMPVLLAVGRWLAGVRATEAARP